jgi:hypothetical protein
MPKYETINNGGARQPSRIETAAAVASAVASASSAADVGGGGGGGSGGGGGGEGGGGGGGGGSRGGGCGGEALRFCVARVPGFANTRINMPSRSPPPRRPFPFSGPTKSSEDYSV